MGYEVANLAVTLCKAEAAGSRISWSTLTAPIRVKPRWCNFPVAISAEFHSYVP